MAININLASYGGTPAATAAQIITAFNNAFSDLKANGGGSLTINAGTYAFGNRSGGSYVVSVGDLANTTIIGYGALFTVNTTDVSMPILFSFLNPENVTVKGLSFSDSGVDLTVNWRGCICLDVDSTTAHSRFKVVDCSVNGCVTFFRSYASVNYTFTGFDIQGTARNCYYAVNVNRNGRFSTCNVKCERCRRGFVSHGARDWKIRMSCYSEAGAIGSNGLIDLVPFETLPVQDCVIDLTITGNTGMYGSMVHLYHQGSTGAVAECRDIQMDIQVSYVTGTTNLVRFSHESPSGTVNSTTISTFRNIRITGSITGAFSGNIISNLTSSTHASSSVQLTELFSVLTNMGALPSYFSVYPVQMQPICTVLEGI